MKYNKMNIEDMLETRKIKDANGENGFSLGIYDDRNALNGFYLKAIKGSLLERVENMYCAKFQLENDAENFRQDARLEMWLSIMKYYDRFGYDEEKKIDGFIYTDCKYKAMDKAKLAKSNVSVCDRNTGKYYINKIESYEKKFIEEIDKIRNQRDEKYISELYNDTVEGETMNEFRKWLNENMENILTKKQVEYLRGEFIIDDVSSVWRINKNIAKRIEKAFAQSKEREARIKKLKKQLKEVQSVLDFDNEKDFIQKIVKLGRNNKSNLITNLYEKLTMDNCKMLTEIISTKGDIEINKEFYYDIIAILTYKEFDINIKINELESEC